MRNSSLLEKLRAERIATRDALLEASADGSPAGRLVTFAQTLDELDERIARAEAGLVPVCRECGGSDFRAWYPVDEGQGIDVERNDDGTLEHDYNGDTVTGEAGADTEYWCLDCDTAARSLEYLVGDTDEDAPAHEQAEEVLEAIRGILSTPGMSAGDVYADVATFLDQRGRAPYDYEDPKNPYAETVHAIDCDMGDDCTCNATERGQ